MMVVRLKSAVLERRLDGCVATEALMLALLLPTVYVYE
jgi:hypothetical protein